LELEDQIWHCVLSLAASPRYGVVADGLGIYNGIDMAKVAFFLLGVF